MKLKKILSCFFILIVAFSFFERNWKASANTDGYIFFDEYSNLSSKDEKLRLNNLARFMLEEEPTFITYILVYNGRNSCKDEAQIRARRANRYLLKKHKISSNRLVIIDGGHRKNLSLEFYVFPKDVSPPTGSPTVEENEVNLLGNCKIKESL